MGCNHRKEGINDIAMEYIDSKGGGCSVFENPAFLDLFGGSVRPGGLAISRRAVELSGLKKGHRVLDVGCGYGVTVELLNNDYGILAEGVDISQTLLEKGRERNPELNLSFGDGELLDYPSLSFDGIFMECVLSLIEKPGEAIHEAYCLLKKGGKLLISDFYLKNLEEEAKAAGKAKNCLDGAFVRKELESLLAETGFKTLVWEEKNDELKEFTASLIMHFGSVDAFFKSTTEESEEDSTLTESYNYKKVGYFLLIAEKK